MSLWSSKDAVNATNGVSKIDWFADGISIDTRTLKEGDLFVALKDQRDGHEYVRTAFENGASAALVSRIPEGINKKFPLLIVDDVLSALENMAKFARERTNAKIIGVTGSVGKTSTKEMLKCILNANGKTHAAERSYNNHWGVPLTLARMPIETNFAVIEIGMNNPDEIRPLAKLANLDVAIVLNVAPVHLKAFENVEGIAYAKAEIFENLSSNDTAIVNNDLSTSHILFNAVKKVRSNLVTFGHSDAANYKFISSSRLGNKTFVKAKMNDLDFAFEYNAEGEHFALNAMAVFAAAEVVGVERKKIIKALSNWQAPSGRGKRSIIKTGTGKIELIDESYNANPISMEAAINVLSESETQGRKVAILGDMGELGANEMIFHSNLAQIKAIKEIDVFYLVGPMMRCLKNELPIQKYCLWFKNVDQLIKEIENLITINDTIMVKGSNYMKVSKIVETLKKLNNDAR